MSSPTENTKPVRLFDRSGFSLARLNPHIWSQYREVIQKVRELLDTMESHNCDRVDMAKVLGDIHQEGYFHWVMLDEKDED